AYPPAGMASSCPPIVSRAEWEARDPSPALVPLKAQPTHVYIHHGATPPDGCHSPGLCAAMVRAYQNFHMFSHGWSDIGYSFLVGEDGRAYEGRGWTNLGRHTLGHNEDSLGFCVIGDFTARLPDQVALTTLKALIQCAVDSGYLAADYVMLGHRDVRATECPGEAFYREIRTWPHYNATAHGWSDIGYSFLVGEDGRAYEGRGWTNVGAHTKGHNEDGLGFCVIGDFTARIPDQVALTTLKALIQCGVDSGYLPQDYVMFGHRDMGDTECPGDRFYAEIRTWPHYNSTR
ncbi:hypothetical protein BaRGS_00034022, partial [Batillaria attramentaria]